MTRIVKYVRSQTDSEAKSKDSRNGALKVLFLALIRRSKDSPKANSSDKVDCQATVMASMDGSRVVYWGFGYLKA